MLRVIRNHRRAARASAPGAYEGLSVTPKGIDPNLAQIRDVHRFIGPDAFSPGQSFADDILELQVDDPGQVRGLDRPHIGQDLTEQGRAFLFGLQPERLFQLLFADQLAADQHCADSLPNTG